MGLTPGEHDRKSFLIAKTASREVATEIFLRLGVDLDDPQSIEEFRDDLDWAKKYRKKCETIGSSVLAGVTTILTGGIIYLLWDALKFKLKL